MLTQVLNAPGNAPGNTTGNTTADAPLVPLLVMPDSADSPQAIFSRVAAAADSTLDFPVLLITPDLSAPDAVETWPQRFDELKADHPLTDRGLVLGCGAGARLAQHFALDHPAGVIACAALSADAWASVQDAARPESVQTVRWLLGCSTDAPGSSMKRAEWFQVELAEAGCTVDLLDWDGPDDRLPDHALDNALRFFNDLHGTSRLAA